MNLQASPVAMPPHGSRLVCFRWSICVDETPSVTERRAAEPYWLEVRG